MRRQMLSLFLMLLILVSICGAVSIVGAASHVTLGQATKPMIKERSYPYIRNAKVYSYYPCEEDLPGLPRPGDPPWDV